MGTIFSIFRRGRLSTSETLEKIEQELQNIEERRWDRLKRDKLIVQLISFICVTTAIVNIFILLINRSKTWQDNAVYCLPMGLFTAGLWQCKKLIQWYSTWSRENEESTLRKLRKEKKKILDNVCETESYKVATELLEKYDPRHLRRRNVPDQLGPIDMNRSQMNLSSISNRLNGSPNRTPLRTGLTNFQPISSSQIKQDLIRPSLNQSINLIHQNTSAPLSPVVETSRTLKNNSISSNKALSSRSKQKSTSTTSVKEKTQDSEKNDEHVQEAELELEPTTMLPTSSTPEDTPETPASGANLHKTTTVKKANDLTIAASSVQGRPVRPVLNKDRSMFEKMVDWVVADGPDHRFALICKSCHGHNGMCLEDEFYKLNFRCCYCYNLNTHPSRP